MISPRLRARPIPLALLAILELIICSQAAADPAIQPAIVLDLPVVFTQAPCEPAAGRPRSGLRLGESDDLGRGARLVLLVPGGQAQVLTEGFTSACEADVATDGKHILFAGKRRESDNWNIFELDLERSTTRQITRNAGNCRHPLYTSSFYLITEKEPWEQIAFVSTRAGAADERTGSPATSLYTCKLDGSFLERITYNLASDLDPAIMSDGRLVYAAWRRATFEDGPLGRLALETINTDGSDRAPMVGRQTELLQRMPCVADTGSLIFVEADGASFDGSGMLSAVSQRRPLHSYRSITTARDGFFHSPAPLPDGRILVSWRPADGSGSLGLYRFDPASRRRELVLDDPRYHELQARAVRPRPRPDGRSSAVSLDDRLAEFYCMSVYCTEFADRSWLPQGSVLKLRVIEGMPAAAAGKSRPPACPPELSARRILAEVPVDKDGSFHLSVPANAPDPAPAPGRPGPGATELRLDLGAKSSGAGVHRLPRRSRADASQSRARCASPQHRERGGDLRAADRGRFRDRNQADRRRQVRSPATAQASKSQTWSRRQCRQTSVCNGSTRRSSLQMRIPVWANTFIRVVPAPVRLPGTSWDETRPVPGRRSRSGRSQADSPGNDPAPFRVREANHHPVD